MSAIHYLKTFSNHRALHQQAYRIRLYCSRQSMKHNFASNVNFPPEKCSCGRKGAKITVSVSAK